ncbi:MAG: ABC transporter permease [Deltaproteobacteria bacterium]|nr:ABC transporter permease [Deltaproteobacteria bacterium]
MIARLIYFINKALASIKESLWISVITTVTIAVVLLALGSYTLVVRNLSQLAQVWGKVASVAVYLQDGISETQWESLRIELAKHRLVTQATLIRPQEALARFKTRGPEAAALVEGVDARILPAYIGLMLAPGSSDLTSVSVLAKELEAKPEVALVDYGREEFQRLQALLNLLHYAGIIGALLIACATIFIVANTVRLTAYARREEIGILGLVGATTWFIRIPFVIEGAIWGAAGGLLAAIIMWLLDRLVAPTISNIIADVLGGLQIRLFAPEVALAAIVGGIILAAIASGIAVRRFLDTELR